MYGIQRISEPSRNWPKGRDGFFGGTTTQPPGTNRRVSCVFVVMGWDPWRPNDAAILRLDNPFAKWPFPDDLLPADFHVKVAKTDNVGFRLHWVPRRPPDV
jgi:hypothetical protein